MFRFLRGGIRYPFSSGVSHYLFSHEIVRVSLPNLRPDDKSFIHFQTTILRSNKPCGISTPFCPKTIPKFTPKCQNLYPASDQNVKSIPNFRSIDQNLDPISDQNLKIYIQFLINRSKFISNFRPKCLNL